MRRDVQLEIITRALQDLIPRATPAFLSVEVTETLPRTGERKNTWSGSVDAVAERVFTALYGRPSATTAAASPLAQAEDAKRARDLGGEIGALMAGERALTSAAWYPARHGDIVHVHYEQAGTNPPVGETYLVEAIDGGLFTLRLLCHSHPGDDDSDEGAFAVEAADDPLYELWFEAGPQRLTIVRDGRVVHDGSAHRGGADKVGMLALAVVEAERYLKRGDTAAALARLRTPAPLPSCGVPGVMPDHADCARWARHGGAHSPDADYVDPPHECPRLPEELYLVMSVGPKGTTVSFDGLYEEKEAAAAAASGYDRHTEAEVRTGYTFLDLPEPSEGGGSLAVIVPLQLLPDPRAEDEWAAEGRATCMDHDPDYGKDLDDE